MVKENNKWPCGGMVDTRDSKSLIRKGVTVQVCSGPPLYQLKVFNSDSVQDNDLKKFCSNWLEVKRKNFELAKRIESDSLVESDLFSLKNYLKDLFILEDCSFKFEAINL